MSTLLVTQEDGACTINPSLASMRKLIRQMLATHYADPANHGDFLSSWLGCLRFLRPGDVLGDAQKAVTIELAHIGKPGEGNVPKQHAIYIDFKGANFNHDGRQDGRSSISEDRSRERVTYHFVGEFMFAHFAPDSDVALSMCESTAEFMIAAEGFMRRNTVFSSIEPTTFSEIHRIGDNPATFRVDLRVKFTAEFSVDRSDESHRIKTVALTQESTL